MGKQVSIFVATDKENITPITVLNCLAVHLLQLCELSPVPRLKKNFPPVPVRKDIVRPGVLNLIFLPSLPFSVQDGAVRWWSNVD